MTKLFLIILLFLLLAPGFLLAQERWSTPVMIDTSSRPYYRGGYLAIGATGTLYTVYSGGSAPGVAMSTDQGNTWTVHDAYNNGLTGTPHDMAIDSRDQLWVLSLEEPGYDGGPFYSVLAVSGDKGQSFHRVFHSLSHGGALYHARLAIDANDNIYLLWADSKFTLTILPGGDSSRRRDIIVPNQGYSIDSNPVIAVAGDSIVHCLWEGYYFDSLGLHEQVFDSRFSIIEGKLKPNVEIDTTGDVGTTFNGRHAPQVGSDSKGNIFVSYTRWQGYNNPTEIWMVKSLDGGETFDPPVVVSGQDTASESTLCIDSNDGINLTYAAVGHRRRHFRSVDGGASFTLFSFYPPIGPSDLKAGENSILYIVGANDSGLGFSRTSVVESMAADRSLPVVMALSPNYPNPFNPSTSLQFSIPKAGRVDLRIYDMTGKEVAVLVSQSYPAGDYTIAWNAAGFSSGVYVARMTGPDNFQCSRRMILLR